MLSTVIVLLLVVTFIVTFVVPLARRRSKEGFTSERESMIQDGRRQYNDLGASLDPILPTFAVASSNIDNNPNLTISQYLTQFNSLTDNANAALTQAIGNADIVPTAESPTNLGVSGTAVKAQLPPPNDLLIKARQCEAKLKGRNSCSKLNNSTYSDCGICIDSGTQFDGMNAKKFIGGLLSLKRDRSDAIDAASGGVAVHQPTLGQCPPGKFYVDAASCQKAVNQLNCKEIGESGGFQGGRTKEGLQMPAVTCAQAPVANEFLYQPAGLNYDVNLRFLAPFGTGLNLAIVTHVPSNRTFKASGRGGQEFTLLIRGVQEQDQVNMMVAQEVPHRPNGKPEVFQAIIPNPDNTIYKIPKDAASDMCQRLGAQLATNSQVATALKSGLQSRYCGNVADKDQSVYAIQSGIPPFTPLGGLDQTGFCDTKMEAQGVGIWCN